MCFSLCVSLQLDARSCGDNLIKDLVEEMKEVEGGGGEELENTTSVQ